MQLLIDIKNTGENKSPPFKVHIICQRLSQISRADNDQVVFLIKAEYAADGRVEILHIITVALLTESAEIVKILPDLRRRHMHQPAQLLGRNPLHSLILQLAEESEIPGKATDYCLRNFFCHCFQPPVKSLFWILSPL